MDPVPPPPPGNWPTVLSSAGPCPCPWDSEKEYSMSKECPSCHRPVSTILQCNDSNCGTMFCMYCTASPALLMPILFLDQEASTFCPSCGGHGHIISVTDDDESADGEDAQEAPSSADISSSTSDTMYSSAPYQFESTHSAGGVYESGYRRFNKEFHV